MISDIKLFFKKVRKSCKFVKAKKLFPIYHSFMRMSSPPHSQKFSQNYIADENIIMYLPTDNGGHEIKIDFVYFTSSIPRSCMVLDLVEEIIIFPCSLGHLERFFNLKWGEIFSRVAL
jgi:hypothetical protein